MFLKFTRHAVERMAERAITEAMVQETIRKGLITEKRLNPGRSSPATTYELGFKGKRVRVVYEGGTVVTVTH
jgi:Domain of unknown function (DUF4258)